MNRITFLFLALLIASCILTVNSRHATRTVITEKSVLSERVNSLQETIRRLELDKARLAAKGGPDSDTCGVDAETAAGAVVPDADTAARTSTAAAPTREASPAAVATTAPAAAKAGSVNPPKAAPAPAAKAKAPEKAADLDDDPLAAALAKMEARMDAKKN